MNLIVDIPEELYTNYVTVQLGRCSAKSHATNIIYNLLAAIKNGTPIPEPHGRIIDESKISRCYYTTEDVMSNNIVHIGVHIAHTNAPTIIEGSDKK